MDYKSDKGMEAWSKFPISFLGDFLETTFDKPILMQPGLSGNYNFTFRWQDPQQMKEAATRQLEEAGLELVPDTRPIEMLVVEKVK